MIIIDVYVLIEVDDDDDDDDVGDKILTLLFFLSRWFHVDGLSSAHVYLRLNANQRLEDVSADTIMECAQFVKANSIEGCKLKETYVGQSTSYYF